MQFFKVKNWGEIQHYRDRTPPWIKLYNHLLDDYEFACLQDASKLHLILIWLLASRNHNRLPFNAKWIKQRIGVDSAVNLDELVEFGFIELEPSKNQPLHKAEHDASKMLHNTEHVADTEREGEGEQRESRGEDIKPPKAAKVSVDFSIFGMSDFQIEELKRIRRKNKGGSISQRVANALSKEFHQAASMGYSFDDLLTEWETRGWKGFKAEWIKAKVSATQSEDNTKNFVNMVMAAQSNDPFGMAPEGDSLAIGETYEQ